MSSEVMTHENWARLHVARRVSDIAKSMIKLSRLGRSIFPTPSHPGPGGEDPAARLKVPGTCRPLHPSPARAYPKNLKSGLQLTAGSPVSDALRASPDKVSAFRLSRHHLSKRAPASALVQVAGDMAGAQAQVLSAAQISLWARTRGLSVDDVDNALWQDRPLVKSWCIRGALHLIPSRDFAVFVRGSDRRNARSTAWLVRTGMPIDAVDRLVEAMRDGLDRPLTRSEIAERITASLGIKSVEKSHRGWGGASTATGFRIAGKMLSLDGIVFLACLRGLACFGPPRGAQATFVRPEKWLPDWNDLPAEKAELELLRRYLRAHGPATVRGFARGEGSGTRGRQRPFSRSTPRHTRTHPGRGRRSGPVPRCAGRIDPFLVRRLAGGRRLREFLLAQLPPQDLSDERHRKRRRELDGLRDFERCKPLLAKRDDVRLRRGLPGLQDHERLYRLAAAWIGDTDRRGFSDRGMHEQDLLDFPRVHVEAGAKDHVLLPVDDVEVAIRVHLGQVAREEPTVAEDHPRFLQFVPIAFHHLWTADRKLPDLALRQLSRRVVGIDHLRVRVGERDADALLHDAVQGIAVRHG